MSRNDVDCRTVSRLISDGLDQRLPAADRARLRRHVVQCRTCQHVSEQMHFLRRAIQQLSASSVKPGADP